MGEYWYLWLIFVALVVVTAVVIVFAGRAVSSHNEETKRLYEEIERLKKLKEKYKELTLEKVENADSRELLDGVCAVLQARIEKAEDGEAEFSKFNEIQKNVYALNTFVEDVGDSNLSLFFDGFSNDFAKTLIDAVKAVNAVEILEPIQQEFDMYDDNNEATSFDKSLLADLDKKFADVYSEKDLLNKIKNYIKSNIDKF